MSDFEKTVEEAANELARLARFAEEQVAFGRPGTHRAFGMADRLRAGLPAHDERVRAEERAKIPEAAETFLRDLFSLPYWVSERERANIEGHVRAFARALPAPPPPDAGTESHPEWWLCPYCNQRSSAGRAHLLGCSAAPRDARGLVTPTPPPCAATDAGTERECPGCAHFSDPDGAACDASCFGVDGHPNWTPRYVQIVGTVGKDGTLENIHTECAHLDGEGHSTMEPDTNVTPLARFSYARCRLCGKQICTTPQEEVDAIVESELR